MAVVVTCSQHPKFGEIGILDFKVVEQEKDDQSGEFLTFLTSLYEAIDELGKQWIETGHAPLIVANFSDGLSLDFQLQDELNRCLWKFTDPRDGQLCFCGDKSNKQLLKGKVWKADIQDAVSLLKRSIQTIPTDEDCRKEIDAGGLAPGQICLVGCQEQDFGDVPQRLAELGFKFSTNEEVADGDFVMFCISCNSGPMAGTRASVSRCHGKRIRPLAIVLTNYISSDSLRSLVTTEESVLLASILAEDVVEKLPILYDFELAFGSKILKWMKEEPPELRCKDSDDT